jgi:hypothetical protein
MASFNLFLDKISRSVAESLPLQKRKRAKQVLKHLLSPDQIALRGGNMATSKVSVIPFPVQNSTHPTRILTGPAKILSIDSKIRVAVQPLELTEAENCQVKERSLALTNNPTVAQYFRCVADRVLEDSSRKEQIEDAAILFLAGWSVATGMTGRLFHAVKTTAALAIPDDSQRTALQVSMAAAQAIELMDAGNDDVLEAFADLSDDGEVMECAGIAARRMQTCGNSRKEIESVLAWLLATWMVIDPQTPGGRNAKVKTTGAASWPWVKRLRGCCTSGSPDCLRGAP